MATHPDRQLNLQHPALVVIDVQCAIDDPRWGARNNRHAEMRIADLLDGWRDYELPIFHIRHDSTDRTSPYRPHQDGNNFKRETRPLPGEMVIAKTTNSAFIGTDLSDQLDDCECDAVVYVGVLANSSVETTVRMSGNLGYRSIVVSDATAAVECVDLSGKRWSADDVHAMSMANLHGEYARVVTTNHVLATLNQRVDQPVS